MAITWIPCPGWHSTVEQHHLGKGKPGALIVQIFLYSWDIKQSPMWWRSGGMSCVLQSFLRWRTSLWCCLWSLQPRSCTIYETKVGIVVMRVVVAELLWSLKGLGICIGRKEQQKNACRILYYFGFLIFLVETRRSYLGLVINALYENIIGSKSYGGSPEFSLFHEILKWIHIFASYCL